MWLFLFLLDQKIMNCWVICSIVQRVRIPYKTMKEFLFPRAPSGDHPLLESTQNCFPSLWYTKSSNLKWFPHLQLCSPSWLPQKFRFKGKGHCVAVFKESALFSKFPLERQRGYVCEFIPVGLSALKREVCLGQACEDDATRLYHHPEALVSGHQRGHIYLRVSKHRVVSTLCSMLLGPPTCNRHLTCSLPLIKSSPLAR